ncbi:MAG: hypothetical protein KAX49_07040 [Halanaerobiales bacterium]|nr:hypothetical protein [Halanaerobiales bacterium]
MILHFSLVYGFLGSIIMASLILTKRGYSFHEIGKMILEGIMECKTLYLLILLIGATVSIWLSSGVVPVMIYYGFQYMKGMNFLFSAFLITSIMSVFMGTAVGTISTIGIALLGIGKGFGVPDEVLLGTIVSGAFIADKISPISGLLNLTLSTTKTKYKSVVKSMLYTLVPVYLITSMIYYFIGRVYTGNVDLSNLFKYQQAIVKGFYVSPWLLLLPLGVVCMSVFGVKIIKTISMGLVGGILISSILQKMAMVDIFHAIFFGYQGATTSSELNSILFSGGISSMLEVLLIVIGAISLSSILEKTGMVKPLVSRSTSTVKSKGELVFKTGMISSILTIVTCDQTVGIILPGRLLKEKYDELGIGQELLARTISDTGTIIAPLFPWNVNALIIGMITGLSAVEYAPYAVLCYIFPLVSVVVSYLVSKFTPEVLLHPNLDCYGS